MTDSDIVKAFESLFKKLLNVKYELKITQKEFLALNRVDTLIKRQQEEIERLRNAFIGECVLSSCSLKAELKSEAIKEFTEKTDKMITEIYHKYIFGGYDLEDEEKEVIMDFCLDISNGFDDLVKEMTE